MFGGTTHSVFNGYSGVNRVLIIEINVAGTKALEATLATGPNIFRGTIHYHSITIYHSVLYWKESNVC